jgi:hypothetical protein
MLRAFGLMLLALAMTVGGKSDFINIGVTTELQDFISERFGVFGNATYRFNTY